MAYMRVQSRFLGSPANHEVSTNLHRTLTLERPGPIRAGSLPVHRRITRRSPMAAIILDSLVLRGSVRLDVVAVEALGTSTVDARVPGNRNSMRHPLPGGRRPEPAQAFDRDEQYPSSGMTPGAGRPRFAWCKPGC